MLIIHNCVSNFAELMGIETCLQNKIQDRDRNKNNIHFPFSF